MSIDLIVSESGKVLIASTQGFEADILRVDFDASTGTVTLAYGDDMPDRALPLTVSNRLMAKVIQAPRVLLVSVNNDGRINGGFDVPLTCTGTV